MQDRDLGQKDYRRLPLRAQWGAAAMAAVSTVLPFASACGGGDGKSGKTPEVVGTLGATNIPIAEATARPTEIPTVIPTATVAKSEVLSPQDLISAGNEVSGIFADGFKGLDVSAIGYDKIPQPVERDLQSIQNAISICTGATPYPYRDDAEKQRMDQDVTLFADGISSACGLAGEASSRLYSATGREQFKQANMLMEKIHHSIVVGFQKKDSRIKDAFWQSLKRQFYPFGAMGTSN